MRKYLPVKLYTNGCSWVRGDELEDRKNESFPYLLKNRLNCELTDMSLANRVAEWAQAGAGEQAQTGSDNQRILRNTLKADLTDCFVIIGWASIIRYEYYDRNSTTWVSNICSAVTEEYPPIHKYFEYDWFVINFLNQVLALQNYLKYNNIPFFFFKSYPMHKEKDMRYLEHFDLIDKDTFPSLFNSDLIFKNYCENNGLNDFMPEGHPTPEQHKMWSEYLYKKIGEYKK